jgi:hypothetical protein
VAPVDLAASVRSSSPRSAEALAFVRNKSFVDVSMSGATGTFRPSRKWRLVKLKSLWMVRFAPPSTRLIIAFQAKWREPQERIGSWQ